MQRLTPESWRNTRPRLPAAGPTMLALRAGAAKAAPAILAYPLSSEGGDCRYDNAWAARRMAREKSGGRPSGFDVQRSAVVMHGA